jgi:hypothetical protein
MPSRVDAGALTTALHVDAVKAIADTVVLAIDWNAERGQELDKNQQVELVYAALQGSANLEARITCAVIDALERGGGDAGRAWRSLLNSGV